MASIFYYILVRRIIQLGHSCSFCIRWHSPCCKLVKPGHYSVHVLRPCILRVLLTLYGKMTCYRITRIVCALLLAKRSVCMRVCKHGCGFKMFCFLRANHASTNLKSFRVQNSTSLIYLPIPLSAETWKILTKKVCQFFFRLS